MWKIPSTIKVNSTQTPKQEKKAGILSISKNYREGEKPPSTEDKKKFRQHNEKKKGGGDNKIANIEEQNRDERKNPDRNEQHQESKQSDQN